ncbi:MAG: lytic transglycosylase domain-containing protein [Sporomusaceae bacterium]|nr:lytic transglycosylase domain-containing protein [Sporomusaceae bacterium]
MRVLSKLRLLAMLLAVGVLAGYWLYSSDWFQRKYIYPFPHQQLVYHYAIQNELDPFLVAAIIRTESKFLPRARSPRGAFGLMQMMPETARWVAKESDEADFSLERLAEPEVSIRMGTWYLANLNREFKGNPVLLLAAYNGGQGNVKEWIQRYGWDRQFSDTAQIPFKETREYVGRVLYSQKRYAELYGVD